MVLLPDHHHKGSMLFNKHNDVEMVGVKTENKINLVNSSNLDELDLV